MANIKFSQFTVGNTESDIDFVVGYKGANNIQISPANLLSATLTGYLPLTGGTMTGNIRLNDNINIGMGNSGDYAQFHDGTNTYLSNGTGDFYIRNQANDKDIIFQSDDGSGGNTEYFKLDGSLADGTYTYTQWVDNSVITFGGSNDLRIWHDSSNSNGYIRNYTSNLMIENNQNDGDIRFNCDNGSGGLTEYFRVDGGAEIVVASKEFRFSDNVPVKLGAGPDFQMLHNGTSTSIENSTGNLLITNFADDSDIIFKSDDGSGGVTSYLTIDGGNTNVKFSKDLYLLDNVKARIGTGSDLQISHDAADSYIQNFTGDLKIFQNADDKDITFYNDDGLGGTTAYFFLDGSLELNRFLKSTLYNDNIRASFGASSDLQIYHDGTHSYTSNNTGNLYIQQLTDDSDIVFQSDDGAGGVTTYFRLDGSLATTSRVYTVFPDNSTAVFGSGFDFQIHHDASNTYLQQGGTGDLYFQQNVDDKDIIFQGDDGSGGTTTYFQLDGSLKKTQFWQSTRHIDNVYATFGTSDDLQIYHDGTTSYIKNAVGNLNIRQNADDADISFQCDDGSGSLAEYFRLDGSSVQTIAEKDFRFIDNAKVILGTGSDLQIYHDGSNSIIKDTGTGDLRLAGNVVRIRNAADTENMISCVQDGEVVLAYDNATKLQTTSTGIKITGISEYADNTAAIAGGLTTGDVYRTGDLLKIVH